MLGVAVGVAAAAMQAGPGVKHWFKKTFALPWTGAAAGHPGGDGEVVE